MIVLVFRPLPTRHIERRLPYEHDFGDYDDPDLLNDHHPQFGGLQVIRAEDLRGGLFDSDDADFYENEDGEVYGYEEEARRAWRGRAKKGRTTLYDLEQSNNESENEFDSLQ